MKNKRIFFNTVHGFVDFAENQEKVVPSHQRKTTRSVSIRTLAVRWRSLRVTADWLKRSHKAKRAW